jgi:4-amino-4-deoxy-L-arabinose transferase-like glycosyltransferase
MGAAGQKVREWWQSRSHSRGRDLFLLFSMLALLPRLLVFDIAIHRERPVYKYQDSLGYIIPAQSLAEGKGFQGGGGWPAFWWPPGYSGFLALIFATGIASPEHLAGALVVQILLASMVAGVVSLLALDLGGVPAALLAGSLMVFEPSSISHANVILSESVFTFILLLAALAWRRWWASPKILWLMAFAGLVGLLPLVRPVATFLWVPLALLLIFARPASVARGPALLAFVALATLPVSAWTLRNYSYLHVPIFATVGQLNEAKFARAVEDMAGEPRAASAVSQPWQEDFGPDQGMSFPQIVKAREDYLRGVLLKHPVAAMERLALTGVGILGVPDSRLPDMVLREVPSFQGGSLHGRLKWLQRLGWLGGLLAFGMLVSTGGFMALPVLAVRARAWPPTKQALMGLIMLLIFYQLLISSFVMYQTDRFRVPIVPLLAVTLASTLLGAGPEEREQAP